jgi:predicted ester cyclase
VQYTEILMIRVVDGRIAEWWTQGDQLGILEQIDRVAGAATYSG